MTGACHTNIVDHSSCLCIRAIYHAHTAAGYSILCRRHYTVYSVGIAFLLAYTQWHLTWKPPIAEATHVRHEVGSSCRRAQLLRQPQFSEGVFHDLVRDIASDQTHLLFVRFGRCARASVRCIHHTGSGLLFGINRCKQPSRCRRTLAYDPWFGRGSSFPARARSIKPSEAVLRVSALDTSVYRRSFGDTKDRWTVASHHPTRRARCHRLEISLLFVRLAISVHRILGRGESDADSAASERDQTRYDGDTAPLPPISFRISRLARPPAVDLSSLAETDITAVIHNTISRMLGVRGPAPGPMVPPQVCAKRPLLSSRLAATAGRPKQEMPRGSTCRWTGSCRQN
jgi:hypothetical protein